MSSFRLTKPSLSQCWKRTNSILAPLNMLKAYSPYTYNKLSNLATAQTLFTKRGGHTIVRQHLNPLLRAHNMSTKYGFSVVSKTLELARDERLVFSGGTPAAWKCRDCFQGNRVKPVAWCVDENQFMAFEFEVAAAGEPHQDVSEFKQHHTLLNEIQHVLGRYELQSLVGIHVKSVSRPHAAWSELK